MSSVYRTDNISYTLYEGDVTQVLGTFASEIIDCVVTSPPYFQLRDYGDHRQIGQEDDFLAYKCALLNVFREIKRVLKPYGTVWINLGDKWQKGELHSATEFPSVLKHMDQWVWAQTVIWHKTNATPYGALRRMTQDHEYFFLMAKRPDYWFDRRGVMVPAKWERWGKQTIKKGYRGIKPIDMSTLEKRREEGKPVRTVWTMPTESYGGQHTATYPPRLAERCIRLGCPEGGVVLDPFCGSGATARAAKDMGRNFIGIDLRADFLDDTLERLAE